MGKTLGAVTGAIINDRAIRKGTKRGRAAYDQAIGTLSAGKEEGIGYLEPYMGAGTGALSTLSGLLMGKTFNEETGEYMDISPEERAALFQESPDYQFRLGQGQKALQASQAARGGLFSGRAGLEALQYGQGAASQEYGSYLSRLATLAGIGQASAGQAANIAGNVASQIGTAQIGSGNLAMQARIARGQQWADAAAVAGSQADAVLGIPSGESRQNNNQQQDGGQQQGGSNQIMQTGLSMLSGGF